MADLAPLYIISEAEQKLFEHVSFDTYSKQLITKTIEATITKRHAVVGWLDKAIPEVLMRSRPTLPPSANEELQTQAKIFFENQVVLAKDQSSAGTGIVHIQTINLVEEMEVKLNDRKKFFNQIGLSFEIARDTNGHYLVWLNRSAQNRNVFTQDPLAHACLLFPINTNIQNKLLFTSGYHLNRSVPKEIFNKILGSVAGDLNMRCEASPDCYSFPLEDRWNEILAMDKNKQDETIQTLLMTNMYIAACLPPNTKYTTPSINGYEQDMRDIFNAAEKYEYKIDPDYIPPQYKQETKNATALIIAAQKGYTSIVNQLLTKGADVNKVNDRGETALTLAARNGHIDIVKKLLEAHANCEFDKLSDDLSLGIISKVKDKLINNDIDHIVADLKEYHFQFHKIIPTSFNFNVKVDAQPASDVLLHLFSKLLEQQKISDANDLLQLLYSELKQLQPSDAEKIIDKIQEQIAMSFYLAIKTNNAEAIHFLMSKIEFMDINFKEIKKCKDPDLRLDIMKWATLNNFKPTTLCSAETDNILTPILTKLTEEKSDSHTPERFRSVSDARRSSFLLIGKRISLSEVKDQENLTSLSMFKADDANFNRYVENCNLIATQIKFTNDESSPRYKAIEALFDVAKKITKQELTHEIAFFNKLDGFINKLPPEVTDKCLFAYTEYAKEVVNLTSESSPHHEKIRNLLRDKVGLDITRNPLGAKF